MNITYEYGKIREFDFFEVIVVRSFFLLVLIAPAPRYRLLSLVVCFGYQKTCVNCCLKGF
jgi:hypothetical protein